VLDAGGDLLLSLLGQSRVGSVADALALLVLHVGGSVCWVGWERLCVLEVLSL